MAEAAWASTARAVSARPHRFKGDRRFVDDYGYSSQTCADCGTMAIRQERHRETHGAHFVEYWTRALGSDWTGVRPECAPAAGEGG